MKKITVTAALALSLTLVGVGPASAAGYSDCGRAYGEFHSNMAKGGDIMGKVHKPGIAHTGMSGFRLCPEG